jgi:hypothetical protein
LALIASNIVATALEHRGPHLADRIEDHAVAFAMCNRKLQTSTSD